MKNNKWLILILLLIMVIGYGLLARREKTTVETVESEQSSVVENDFLLEDYPLKEVPLYKLEEVSSNKIFVNTDPKNLSTFGGANYAYYNVVLNSKAGQEEFLNYYRNLFDSEIKEEYDNPEMVKGNIGKYKVTAAHYGDGETGYIQVYLADYKDSVIDKYFVNFPEIVETKDFLVEHEKSFGLLNQKGGEEEYTKYFTVIDSGDKDNDGNDDVDEFSILEKEYKDKFINEPEYNYNQESGLMSWKSGEYRVNLSISRDHGRIYLMIRKNIDK